MREHDKIRVLLIDDREEMDGYPEGQITPPEYQEWFEIVHPGFQDEALSFRSATEFAPVVRSFWFADDTSILPAEIIATDYNLSKRGRLAVVGKNSAEAKKSFGRFGGRNQTVHSQVHEGSSSASLRGVNFEGLLISLFYGTLSYKHPAAIVPMTRYLSEMPSEVETLHALVEPFLGVDFQYIGLADRRWTSILKEGVKHLRRRIEDLFESGDITLAPSDLMTLAEDARHGVLTMRSPHAVRMLPVQGLFIDVAEEKRGAAIQKWARDLMRTVMVDCEEFRRAQKLAKLVWDAYNDNVLVEDRKRLSMLAAQKAVGEDYDQVEFKRLCSEDHFNVKNFRTVGGHAGGKCGSGYFDITLGSNNVYSGRVRRWAALLIIYNLLKRLSLIRKKAVDRIENASKKTVKYLPGPALTVNDLFLALFPVPKSPLTVPWHVRGDTPTDQKKRSNAMGTWVKDTMRFKDKFDIAKDKGDLALSVYDVFDGSGWNECGPYGLFSAERVVLQGIVLGDIELGASEKEREHTMRAFEDANRIIYNEMETS